MHPQEEVRQPQEAERREEDEEAAQHQEQRHHHLEPERRVHSITSPRRMNLAMAEELTKLKRAMSSAASK